MKLRGLRCMLPVPRMYTVQAVSDCLSSTRPLTSSNPTSRPLALHNSHHTTSIPSLIDLSSTRNPVHCRLLLQTLHFHRVHPQNLHCPRLFTSCCFSSCTAATSSPIGRAPV